MRSWTVASRAAAAAWRAPARSCRARPPPRCRSIRTPCAPVSSSRAVDQFLVNRHVIGQVIGHHTPSECAPVNACCPAGPQPRLLASVGGRMPPARATKMAGAVMHDLGRVDGAVGHLDIDAVAGADVGRRPHHGAVGSPSDDGVAPLQHPGRRQGLELPAQAVEVLGGGRRQPRTGRQRPAAVRSSNRSAATPRPASSGPLPVDRRPAGRGALQPPPHGVVDHGAERAELGLEQRPGRARPPRPPATACRSGGRPPRRTAAGRPRGRWPTRLAWRRRRPLGRGSRR